MSCLALTHERALLGCSRDTARSPKALVVQVTSYLMMGALSPGLKRHSVTLFEGERTQYQLQRPSQELPLMMHLIMV